MDVVQAHRNRAATTAVSLSRGGLPEHVWVA
jgi:hypothetical protein